MSNTNPINLLFGGMEKLGPGSNSDTLKVLAMLPRVSHKMIVDAGCGSGRQTRWRWQVSSKHLCTPWIPMSLSCPTLISEPRH